MMSEPSERLILVVDDSPPTCLYLKRLLERKGYRVLTAGDGTAGARMAMERKPDLILLDKEMPGMHGFAVSRLLRQHRDTSGIPILMISSESGTEEKIRGLDMGADDFIAKGISGEELYSKINAFLRIKDLQDRLQRESDKLNQIFHYLHEPVAICGTDDHLVLASQVFLNLLRMPPEVTQFKTMTEILHTIGVEMEVIEHLRAGTHEDVRLVISLDGQVTHLQCRTARINLVEDNTALAYIFRDITGEVESEQMKADFHSMIAHDLRSPMSVIQGYVSLMTSGKTGAVNPTQSEFLESVNRKISEMTSLLNDFLDINKIDAGFVNLKCDDMNLGELMGSVVDDLTPMADSSDITIEMNLPDAPLLVHADSLRVTQILRNLLSNAIKYNVEGGWIRLSLAVSENRARVEITDGGIGMGEDELRVLFQPYTRGSTQRRIKGVGLGVVIVKKLVESHGGAVTVTSSPGHGSCFVFTLPLAAVQADQEPEFAAPLLPAADPAAVH